MENLFDRTRDSQRFDWTPGRSLRENLPVSDFTQHPTDAAPHEDLTAAEAARRLGVSSLHVIDLLEAGELDFHMVGSDICFDAADVASYKADRESRDQEHLDHEHLVGA
jgi:excisionase family DNA binding protein